MIALIGWAIMTLNRIRLIGLTGGIASGKSSVARFFEERGVPVIDADQLARDAVLPGSPAIERIALIFGNEVLAADGSLDRKKLGALIFASADKRHQLENILHPEIRRLSEDRIRAATADGHRLLVYMAPLLIEAGVTDRVDEIWVVTVRPDIQLERLMRREGISRDKALGMIASQMPLAEKELHGKVVIDNSGTPEQTHRILEDIWNRETGNNNE
jgi:dephospho-CoA kinase